MQVMRLCGLAVILGGALHPVAAAPCDLLDPRASVSTTTEAAIKGSLSSMLRVLTGKAEIIGRYKSDVKNLSDTAPVADRAMIEARAQYLLCLALMDTKAMPRRDAIDIVTQVATPPSAPAQVAVARSAERQTAPPKAAEQRTPAPRAEPNAVTSAISVGTVSAPNGNVVVGSNNTITQTAIAKVDETVLQSLLGDLRRARLAAALAESQQRFPVDWRMAEQLHTRGTGLLTESDPAAKEVLENAAMRYRDMAVRAVQDMHLQEMQVSQEREQRLRAAYDAAAYAQSRATAKKNMTPQDSDLYQAAYAKLKEGLHLGRSGGHDEAALKAYKEAQDLWERIAGP